MIDRHEPASSTDLLLSFGQTRATVVAVAELNPLVPLESESAPVAVSSGDFDATADQEVGWGESSPDQAGGLRVVVGAEDER
jgi:hypothetical protein